MKTIIVCIVVLMGLASFYDARSREQPTVVETETKGLPNTICLDGVEYWQFREIGGGGVLEIGYMAPRYHRSGTLVLC